MRLTKYFSVVLGCVILTLAFAMAGCGKSSTAQTDAADLVQLAQVCNDTCNTIMSCMQEETGNGIPEEAFQAGLADCLENCPNPAAEEEQTRDCVIACDLSVDCAAYLQCICGCGLEVIEGCV